MKREPDKTREVLSRPGWVAVLLLGLSMIGCQQKMADQPSYQPLEPSASFSDGRSARPRLPRTIARGELVTDVAYFTGRRRQRQLEPSDAAVTTSDRSQSAGTQGTGSQGTSSSNTEAADENNQFVDQFPLALDEAVIQHGRNRYTIYCKVCHDTLGTGLGKIVERGYTRPPSYHIPRLREAPVGRLFAVVTEGYGSMPSYAGQISVDDRWAIVAYVRALQLSQHFPVGAMSDEMQTALARASAGSNSVPETSAPAADE